MPRVDQLDSHSLKSQPELPEGRRPEPAAIAELFEEWMRGDEREQHETFEFLRRALDEDRQAGYKLFP